MTGCTSTESRQMEERNTKKKKKKETTQTKYIKPIERGVNLLVQDMYQYTVASCWYRDV